MSAFLASVSSYAIIAATGGGSGTVPLPADAAHRYWRLDIVRWSGDGTYSGLSGIRLYENGVNVNAQATPTTNRTIQAGSLAAVMGEYSSSALLQYAISQGTNTFIDFDFGTGNAKNLDEVGIYPNKDATSRSPAAFWISYSDDGVTYTRKAFVRYGITSDVWTVGTERKSKIPAYMATSKIWAIFGWDPSGSMGELEFQVGGVDQTTGQTPFASTNYSSSEGAAQAIDDNNTTNWSGGTESFSTLVGVEFATAIQPDAVSIQSRNDTTYWTQTPWQNVYLGYGDNRGVYRVKSLLTQGQTTNPYTGANQKKTYTVPLWSNEQTPTLGYFDTGAPTALPVVSAWGLRKLVSTYTGPLVRIRDADGERDLSAGADGYLSAFTSNGPAYVVRLYNQAAGVTGDDLIHGDTAKQPILIPAAMNSGRPAIKFDGVDDFLYGETQGTTRSYMVAKPNMYFLGKGGSPREWYAAIAKVASQYNANPEPYARYGLNFRSSGTEETQLLEARYNSTAASPASVRGYSFTSAQGVMGWFLGQGRFYDLAQTGDISDRFQASGSADVTYPLSTSMYVGSNGAGDENWGGYMSEMVIYSGQFTDAAQYNSMALFLSKQAVGPGYGEYGLARIRNRTAQSGTTFGLAEFEARSSVGGADLTLPGVAGATSEYSTSEAGRGATDGSTTVLWSTEANAALSMLYMAQAIPGKAAELKVTYRNDQYWTGSTRAFDFEQLTSEGWETVSVDIGAGVSGGVYTVAAFTPDDDTEEPPVPVYSGYSFSIPAGKTAENLTGFVVRLNLANFPAELWEVAGGAGSLRVYTAAGTALPIDVISFDAETQKGELFFRADLSATAANWFVLNTEGTGALAVTDPLGRNAVWADYESVFIFPDNTDRTGSGNNATRVGTTTGGSDTEGWLNLYGSGYAVATVPMLTQWTMAASVIPRSTAANGAILSYTPPTDVNDYRATMAVRGGGQFGIWNATNGWVSPTSPTAAVGTRRRLAHTQTGSSDRAIFIDGLKRANGVTVQRPATLGSTTVLYMGTEDLTVGERLVGSLNYIYLRGSVLSSGWIAAEQASWETDTFVTVAV